MMGFIVRNISRFKGIVCMEFFYKVYVIRLEGEQKRFCKISVFCKEQHIILTKLLHDFELASLENRSIVAGNYFCSG